MAATDLNLSSAVRSDTLPAVGSMIVPGVVASTPYIALLWGEPHNLKGFVDANQGASTAAAAIVVVAAGLIVDTIGSYVEHDLIDTRHTNPAQMRERWRE